MFMTMPRPVHRAAVAAGLAIVLMTATGAAGQIDTYRAKTEAALAHLRAAWSYARTANGDLAGIEADAFLTAWDEVERTVPSARAGDEAKMAALVDKVRKLGTDALDRIDSGRLAEAKASLAQARGAIREFQRDAGIETFADCIWDANRAGDALWIHIPDRPDLRKAGTGTRVGDAARAYSAALTRCNETAPPDVAGQEEFRRLMDGALASLVVVGQAVAAGDGGLLHRYLIEIISIDRLLYFRYG
jgi:hypothetical protein